LGIRAALQRLAWAANCRIGTWFPYAMRKRVYRWLYPPGSRKPLIMYIDVVGSCNLRCPSCPVGNMGSVNPSGLMDKALFAKIIAKAAREYHIGAVYLFNWTEPLLHPELPELIRLVKNEGLFCGISSNLNVMKNIDEVLRAAPDDFRISLSGFTQEVYGQTHAHGQIERVKQNMRLLSEAKKRVRNKHTRIHVYFHKYKHNVHEIEPMQQYAGQLGFDWHADWAYYMPLERTLELAEGRLAEDQQQFVAKQFALPIVEAIHAAGPFKDEPCDLLDDQITVDVHGNVNLCCAVYELEKNRLGRFLDLSPDDLRQRKRSHATCARCTEHGLHRYFTYYDHPQLRPLYDELARSNVAKKERPAHPLPLAPTIPS
jgi:MoaA/NifB/PqqE/SkfB family radical SAM enzyme